MQNVQNEPIAIIGIGCRFPGANTPRAFWELLSGGKDAIREVPADRWDIDKLFDPNPAQPGKMVSRWGGFIDQVDQFDWRTFRLLPREVKQMDPQQRLLLEVTWEAFEDAGLPLKQIAGSQTSVFMGIGWSDYLRLQTRDWSHIDGYTAMGNASCFAANRISYIFDLRGPSISLDAGCTSSLSATYLACQSLWNGEASLAIAGGVNLMLSPDGTIMVSQAGLLSPQGRCKTLDIEANGFVRGEGAGIIILKPLSQVQPTDRVYACIRGIAINHNGRNEWIIASSQSAQEELLRRAYQKAGVDPADVDYVELHGTAFQRGDPIETKALGAVLGTAAHRREPCRIGSVKTNIGHLEAAAGMASIIKVALSLHHKAIPPTLNLQTVNPAIPLQQLQLTPQLKHSPWPDKEGPAIAGVTTLAFTGANAHAVLEAPYIEDTIQEEHKPITLRLLPLSARSAQALYAQAAQMQEFLTDPETARQHSWKNICYTASLRRDHYEYRLAIASSSTQEATAQLNAFLQKPSSSPSLLRKTEVRQKRLVFLFAHQAHLVAVADSAFLHKEETLRAAIDACAWLFRRHGYISVWKEIDALPQSGVGQQPSVLSAPVLFTLQVALARLWNTWGVVPDAVLGQGLGEIAAAHVAGALSLEDAIPLLLKTANVRINPKPPVRECHASPAAIPIYSALDGFIDSEQLLISSHMGAHSRKPELHTTFIDQLLTSAYDLFVELGPPSVLLATIGERLQHFDQSSTLLSSLHYDKEPNLALLEAAATLHTSGYELNWSAFFAGESCRCVGLPTYSWQRERLWPEGLESISQAPAHQYTSIKESSTREDTANNSVEEVLIKLWEEVLGLQQIQPTDSFFKLGGHSLLAIQLLTRIRTTLHTDISLSSLLQTPTPGGCAELITASKAIDIDERTQLEELPLLKPYPNERYEPFPITDVQQVYWVGRHAAFELGNVGNHGYIEVEADDLDLERLSQSMQRLIERHDMLRAVLLPDGQQQVLTSVPPFQIHVCDLRTLAPDDVTVQLEHIRYYMDHQLLSVEQWPAFELRVSHLNDQRVRLHLSIESLFVDAWSMNLLVKEFIHLYYDLDRTLPPLELSFRDYMLAEATLHDTKLYQRSRDYWLTRLPDLFPAPDLPLAQNPTALSLPRFVHREAGLSREHWQNLKAKAAQVGLTPSGVLLAAFAEVLTVWSKTARFSINLSLFNRFPLHPQVNSIVGDFTSLIVLAVDNSVPEAFEQRAKRLQKQLWDDLDHSYYSGISVLRELARTQGGMAKAVMPIVFTSLLIQDVASDLPAPWQKTIYCVSQTPQVWLDHQVLEQRGALVFHWQAVEALFPEGFLDAMFEAYCAFLERLCTHEECWQETVRLLIPADQITQQTATNTTQLPLPKELLHSSFERQADRYAHHPAVISPERTMSYEAVYIHTMHIASRLRQWEVRSNQLIGIVMEKGWEQVVAACGILIAGAAYLPIDPKLPTERLYYLLDHGRVEFVLTQTWIDKHTDWPPNIRRLCVDSMQIEADMPSSLQPLQGWEDLAYVIYTSGSTGLPKGVMIDHQGAVNTIQDINQRFHVGPEDRVLALSSLNFDLSVYDIFGLLAAGGAVVLPPEEGLRDPACWLELLIHEQVTIWNSVPALLQMFVEYAEGRPEIMEDISLRLVMLSGDWIPVSLPGRLRKLLPKVEIISLGGATEASIWSILYPITKTDPTWNSIPYGKPMYNQQFFVLNDALEPCPTWVPGQLYIGGTGLARGYWRDEEKTRTSFFTHPNMGTRLYRTGDLGRYLPDGNIEFLGREDFQVKVQGYRIELGEIEAALSLHSSVHKTVVAAIGERGDDKQIVAYIVPQAEYSFNQEELRAFLRDRLPGYMVPAVFIQLEALPLSANGKIDRKALPKPAQTSIMTDPNNTATEGTSAQVTQMSQIIAPILKVHSIDAHTSLLEYGATSLSIIRIVNQLERELQFRPGLNEFFRYPTLSWLATAYEQHLSHIQGTKMHMEILEPGLILEASLINEYEEGVL